MITRSIFIYSLVLMGTFTAHARTTDYIYDDGFTHLSTPTTPNYIMSYKICFGDDCTYGDEAFVRDNHGLLSSAEKQEAVLDFIWNAVADAKALNAAAKPWQEHPENSEPTGQNLMQRHMPEMAQRERFARKSEPLPEVHIQNEDLSVSISFSYDQDTLPQIMQVVECLKYQINEYKDTQRYNRQNKI